MSANHGYYHMHAPLTCVLSPRKHGSGLPGSDRGECLEIGQQQRPTAGLQKLNALRADDEGRAVTLPQAAPSLKLSFENIGSAAVDLYALPGVEAHGPAEWPARHHEDRIDSLAPGEPFVLEAGHAVTMTGALGRWSSSS